MISRVWHGYTSSGNAEAYEALLKSEIFAGIAARGIAGYRGIQLFRRNLGEEVEASVQEAVPTRMFSTERLYCPADRSLTSRNLVLLNGTKHDEHGHFNAGSPPVATALSP